MMQSERHPITGDLIFVTCHLLEKLGMMLPKKKTLHKKEKYPLTKTYIHDIQKHLQKH